MGVAARSDAREAAGMAEHTIKMPDVGEGVAEAELVEWHVKVGDPVREDMVLHRRRRPAGAAGDRRRCKPRNIERSNPHP